MIGRGTLFALTASIVACAGHWEPALAATGSTAGDLSGSTINIPLADPSAETTRSAPPVARGPRENPPSGNPLWAVPLRSLSVTRQRPIFSPSRRPPTPAAVAAPAPAPPPPVAAAPPEPDHPLLSLVGTIIGEADSIAVFVDEATRSTVRLRTGEDHAGWTLRSVRGREATFEKGSQKATLALPRPGVGPMAQPAVGFATGTLPDGRWVDGDGQVISPPPRRTVQAPPQPAVGPPPGSAPVAAVSRSWVDGDGQVISPPSRMTVQAPPQLAVGPPLGSAPIAAVSSSVVPAE